MCNKFETNTKFFEYVDDVNILIYEKNIEKNCRNFEKVHEFCERWAIRHEFVFVSIKYELIHFIKIRKNSTWRSRSTSIRTRFNRKSIFEFSICKSTHDWNGIHTYEKFKKKWRNKSWFSRSCRFSFKKRFFARHECCTFSLFARFSFMTSLFDTWLRIKNREWSINAQLYKIVVYETFSNRFESFRFRFWKLKRTSFSSICIWISCKFKLNIVCESQTCRTSFVKNVNQ
jgi:hypothetical protein